MSEEMHVRATELIARERVEGVSADERGWLAQHLAECPACAELARGTEQTIRSLRGVSVALPRTLASRTQMRVRLRARQMQAYGPRWHMVWLACGLSWLFGAATAPYIWRGLEWVGHRLGVPNLVWEMGFGLWWALPLVVAALVMLITDAGRSRQNEWKGQES
jgi:anti-sigma factor RsiW